MEVLLSLGTNTDYANIKIAEERLRGLFSAVRVSSTLISPALNSPGEIHDFANMVMAGETEMPYDELHAVVKTIETEMGRDRTKTNGDVDMDIDLLKYGDSKYKQRDWDRPYNVLLFKELGLTL